MKGSTNRTGNYFALSEYTHAVIQDIIEYSSNIRQLNRFSNKECFKDFDEGTARFYRYVTCFEYEDDSYEVLYFIHIIGGLRERAYSKLLQICQNDIHTVFASFRLINDKNNHHMRANLFACTRMDLFLKEGLKRLNKLGLEIVDEL